MLYLEDYIELVEILPQELRDRFTEMRLLDLQSQNAMDQLQNKINHFFQMANTMSPEQRQREYETLLQEYNKPLADSEEKINLSTQIEDFLHKYTRKLEQDIQKFKLELEADNSGITEILEKRVSESQQKENQRSNLLALRNKMNSVPRTSLMRSAEPTLSSATSVPAACNNSVNYSLSNIGAGGMAITAAATQAIAATQQMKQGRRTASLKASYEAIHGAASSTNELSLVSRELAGAAQSAIAASQEGSNKKNKKKSTGGSSQGAKGQAALGNLSMGTINMSTTSSALHSLMMETSTQHSKHHTSLLAASSGAASQQVASTAEEEAAYGADEPRYCQCNEVAFGVMVACDSKNCPYEWYHCECVGIAPENPPKGKWYCPLCTEKMKQYPSSGGSRKHRKN